MKTAKVFGVNLDGKYRGIVCAQTQKDAAELFKMSLYNFRQYGCETGNKEEIEIATKEPNIVWKRSYALGAQWIRVKTLDEQIAEQRKKVESGDGGENSMNIGAIRNPGFTGTLSLRVDKELRIKKFTAENFIDIAEQFGARRKDINDTLRKFEIAGLITAVKLTPCSTGGSPRKTFMVTKGADFTVKNAGVKHYRREAKLKEQSLTACFNRLDKVVTGWARV